jgi:hypothetical protein
MPRIEFPESETEREFILYQLAYILSLCIWSRETLHAGHKSRSRDHFTPSSHKKMLTILTLFPVFLAASCTTALTLPELRHRSIYQVLTDRFARHDGLITECDTGKRDYCGGSWKGIEGRLGYIQDMGFDTGWSNWLQASNTAV